MDIRPVDVQMIINKTSQVSRFENKEQANSEQKFLFSDHFKKNTENESKKSTELNKSEKNPINKDGKGKEDNRKKQEKEKQEKEQDKQKKSKLSFLDISI